MCVCELLALLTASTRGRSFLQVNTYAKLAWIRGHSSALIGPAGRHVTQHAAFLLDAVSVKTLPTLSGSPLSTTTSQSWENERGVSKNRGQVKRMLLFRKSWIVLQQMQLRKGGGKVIDINDEKYCQKWREFSMET